MINVEAASEGDLIEMERWLSQNGSGNDVVAIREFIAIVRDEIAQPLAITITNAHEIGKIDKAPKVSRDSDGKLTGATIVPIEWKKFFDRCNREVLVFPSRQRRTS